ncbi:type VI secretion system contractile sheath large subunit [Methylicorpusculum oleiharenae]|uniref:type VI secretion system contractile sheath domain-containing protein n=1 Tax=Methylicorpusculum oleiharenae TaxID=1338687 RepID=UPI001359C000|nr:type VI secretion system contractile sheath large subunit [Methylicorpusculum oleiharenae]MCD2451190.1 type VI secretion system contractile sheath large subunit [Methylicorpusculum oleiharenae]
MPGRIDFKMGFKTLNPAHKIPVDTGFRIYILGGFSGQSAISWEQRKIREINIDNFDQVMTQINPMIEINSGLTLQFKTREAFHPDAWFDKVPILTDLLQLKSELGNTKTAAQAAAKINAFRPVVTESDHAAHSPIISETQEDLLQRLLGKKSENAADKTDSVQGFIDQIVSPYISQETKPEHEALINVIDVTISRFLQTQLHSPSFQNLEALWMATEALVNEDSGDRRTYFLVDIRQDELLAEQKRGSCVFEQKLLQQLQAGDGDQQTLLLAGDYYFSGSEDDKALLTYFSQLAATCNSCLLGGVHASFIENTILNRSDKVPQWEQFFNEINADRVVLAYPRYLLRLPYGNKRNPIDTFDFEECSIIPQSRELLWGHPAFLCTRGIIKNSEEQSGDEAFFFSDIPAFAFDQDGEKLLQPCVEMLLNEAQITTLLSRGIMPLIGFRQRQGIRLAAVSTLI